MGHTILGRLGLGRLLTVAGLAVAWVEQSPDTACTGTGPAETRPLLTGDWGSDACWHHVISFAICAHYY